MSEEKGGVSGGSAGAGGPKKVFNMGEWKEEKEKKKSGSGGRPKKPTPMEIIMPYVDSLLDLPSKSLELDHTFMTMEMDQMIKLPMKVDEGQVVRYVTPKAISNEIIRHSKHTPGFTAITPANARMAYEFFEGATTALKEDDVSLVLEKSKPGYCWHRLAFDFEKTPTPHFDELFNRVDENALALKQWIGSLFDPGASRQHYVWIWGVGGQGKGAIGRFLFKTFGPAYKAVIPPKNDDKFWTFNLIGKRLVVFNDCTDVHFPTSGLGKSLVGGDPIPVEKKGGDSFTAIMKCLFMYNSNKIPSLSSEVADTRRAIIVHVDSREDGSEVLLPDVYDQLLWEEAPGFLFECIQAYKACNGKFTIDTEGMDDLIKENEMPLQNLFDKYFEYVSEDNLLMKDGKVLPNKEQRFVSPQEFQIIMDTEKKGSDAKNNFTAWIMRAYQVKKFRDRKSVV